MSHRAILPSLGGIVCGAMIAGCGSSPGVTSIRALSPASVSVPAAYVSFELVETISPTPPGDYSGFGGVAQIGTITLAHGFDDEGTPGQPERSAVWSSDDLQRWERIGIEISAGDDQQTIVQFVLDGDTVHAVVTDFSRVTSGKVRAMLWTSRTLGDTWAPVEIGDDALLSGGTMVDGKLVAFGLTGSLDDSPRPTTWVIDPSDGSHRSLNVDNVTGSANAFAVSDDRWLAAGAAAEPGTDFKVGDLIGFIREDDSSLPLDAALWASTDHGQSWSPLTPDEWVDADGQQGLDSVIVDGDTIVVSGANLNNRGLTSAFIRVSTDRGATWEEFLLSDSSEFPTWVSSLQFIDGLVLGSSVGNDTSASVFLLDPATGDFAIQNLTDVIDITQIEAIVEIDGAYHAFGRFDRRGGDLQVATVTITRTD